MEPNVNKPEERWQWHQQRTRDLLGRIAALNPNAGEIGPGMLQYIVNEARLLLTPTNPKGE